MSRTLTLLALAAAMAGCGINKRTSEFTCESDADCDADRRCEEGYCTVGVRGIFDAAPGTPDAPVIPVIDASPPDAFICPGACTGGCDVDFTCLIDCSADASCAEPIVCPANLPCQVTCTGAGSCLTTIDCSMAAGCDITCGADGACSGEVSCAADQACAVNCANADTCAAGVSCADACSCEVLCAGAGSCAMASECPPAPANKCRTGNGCNTTGHNDCDTCPP